ncbi:hypothetical protein D5S17_11520 [Pseudonocardiaceae bacterium YIM PH 21723]|nr:hypothetical protein D5S17_11520 [Pseudonocardiaceae bacterium YIM PH 21723]
MDRRRIVEFYLGPDQPRRTLRGALVLDGVVAVSSALLLLLDLTDGEGPIWYAVAGLTLMIPCAFTHRRWPLLTLLISSAAGVPAGPAYAYSAGTRFRAWQPTIPALVGSVLLGTPSLLVDPTQWPGKKLDLGALLFALLIVFAVIVIPYLLGMNMGQRRELLGALRERTRQLEQERLLLIREARTRERGRIARDMHDSLGHHLSLLALHIGGLQVNPRLGEPERVVAERLHGMVHTSMEELRDIISVLRQDDEETAVNRRLTAEQLTAMVADARQAGQQTTLAVHGEPRELPMLGEQAVFRLVQEGLTNARKHAPGTVAALELRYEEDMLHAKISNGAPGSTPRLPSGGRGLAGLSERVRHAGGTMNAYRPAHGGFVLSAMLPYDRPAGEPVRAATTEVDEMLAKIGANTEWVEPRPRTALWLVGLLFVLTTVALIVIMILIGPVE